MSKVQRSRWALPADPEPANTRCFKIEIPDDPLYIAAFKGALYDLSKPYAWGDDESHTALTAGARMWTAYTTIEEVDCELATQTLIQFDDLCGLQWSYDGGETWQTANFENCARYGAQQEIQDAIDDGVLQGGAGQQSPQEPPAPGECHTFHVRLNAKDTWICPIPVEQNDTIFIQNEAGGWWDGGVGLVWSCADGSYYGLGECYGSWSGQAGDPIPMAKHMQLIGKYGSTYFDPLIGTFTMPVGEVEQNFYIQANDSNLTDNMGEVNFDVIVCKGLWYHLFDFRTGMHGWVLDGNTTQDGSGLVCQDTGDYRYASATFTLLRDGAISQLRVTGTYSPGSNHENDTLRMRYEDASLLVHQWAWDDIEAIYDKSATVNKDVTTDVQIRLIPGWQKVHTGGGTIATLEVWGTGPDPFA